MSFVSHDVAPLFTKLVTNKLVTDAFPEKTNEISGLDKLFMPTTN